MIPVLHSAIHSQTSSGELGDFWDSGRLRCLQSKIDTTISRVNVLLALPSIGVCGLWYGCHEYFL